MLLQSLDVTCNCKTIMSHGERDKNSSNRRSYSQYVIPGKSLRVFYDGQFIQQFPYRKDI